MDTFPTSPCETLAERYQALLEVAEAISAHRDLHVLFRDLAQRLPRVVHVNFVALSLHDPVRNTMRLHTIQANVPADLVGGHEGPVELAKLEALLASMGEKSPVRGRFRRTLAGAMVTLTTERLTVEPAPARRNALTTPRPAGNRGAKRR